MGRERQVAPLSSMADFKRLLVWQKAHALALNIDRLTKRIRARQYESLKNQIFRAGLSIPANIAEGRQKESQREFVRFLGIAASSSSTCARRSRATNSSSIISPR